jgi:hypothetical protein
MGVALTPLKARLFDIVREAGPGGITGADINKLVFGGRASPANVRMNLSQLNALLARAGVRIEGGVPLRGRFRLVRANHGGCRGS